MREAKIVMIGLDNAGKTTILKSISNEGIKSISPTKGFNVKEIVKNNLAMKIWDLGGFSLKRTKNNKRLVGKLFRKNRRNRLKLSRFM